MNRYIRMLFTILLPPSFYLSGILAGQAFWSWGVLAILFLLYMLLVWLEREWWTRTRYLLVVGLAWALILVMRFLDSSSTYDSVLLVPLVLLLIKEQGDQRYFTGGLTLATLAFMLVIAPTLPVALFVFLATVPLAITIRAINVHKEPCPSHYPEIRRGGSHASSCAGSTPAHCSVTTSSKSDPWN